MSQTTFTAREIARRGQELFEARIRPQVESSHRGEYAAIDVHTGEFEVDPDSLAAAQRLRNRLPESSIFFVRIGVPPIRLGGGLRRLKQ